MSVDRTTEILETIKIGSLNADGGLDVNIIRNFESEDTLSDILTQMKIMNMHLSILTDITIKNSEVE